MTRLPTIGSLFALLAVVTVSGAPASETPPPLSDQDFLYDGAPAPALVALGRALFFDPILSGNQNISCGTCHDPALGSGDGLALSIGEGGLGFGPDRRTGTGGVTGRVPRNAQPLYNVGARAYTSFFHDGRLEPDPLNTFQSGFWSPAREHLPDGLDNLLAAQAMFPVLSAVEMAGQKSENPVALAVAEDRPSDAWAILANRLAQNSTYRAMFDAAFGPGEITFVQAANALAAFQATAFRSEGSPFHRMLADGDLSRLSPEARVGMGLFYGRAGCSGCHSGPLLTDHKFHAIAMPQIGPGKGHGSDTSYWRESGFIDRLEDEGRFRVTFEDADRFAFRTPSLVNVALTGPWGHSGAYDTLEQAVRHHADPVAALYGYDVPALPRLDHVIEQTGRDSQLIYRPMNPARRASFDARDGWVQANEPLRARIAQANALAPTPLSNTDIGLILAFLDTLTDPAAQDLGHLVPASVPSGLPPQPGPAEPRP